MPEQPELLGRVALVTGSAGEGIGSAVARRLASEGAALAVVDKHAARSADVASALRDDFDVRAMPVVVDLADRGAVDHAIAQVEAELGPIDILVNNAALNVQAKLSELDPADWDRVVALDLSACFYLTRRCLPSMIERERGAIVNVSSIASFGYQTELDAAYAAAKAGLNGLTRATALEGAPHGVRCNAVAPGLVWTKFTRKHAERFQDLLERTPLGRFAEPEDIANVVFFLCSEQSRHMTGEVLNVSGGAYLRA